MIRSSAVLIQAVGGHDLTVMRDAQDTKYGTRSQNL